MAPLHHSHASQCIRHHPIQLPSYILHNALHAPTLPTLPQAVSVLHDVGRMVLVALAYKRELPMYSLVSTFLIDEVPDRSHGQLQASVLQCADHPLVVQPDVAEEFAAADERVETGLLSIYSAEQPGMQVGCCGGSKAGSHAASCNPRKAHAAVRSAPACCSCGPGLSSLLQLWGSIQLCRQHHLRVWPGQAMLLPGGHQPRQCTFPWNTQMWRRADAAPRHSRSCQQGSGQHECMTARMTALTCSRHIAAPASTSSSPAGEKRALLLAQVFGKSGWRDVLLKPNQVLVLPGQTLSYALAGQVAATKHRVVGGCKHGLHNARRQAGKAA